MDALVHAVRFERLMLLNPVLTRMLAFRCRGLLCRGHEMRLAAITEYCTQMSLMADRGVAAFVFQKR